MTDAGRYRHPNPDVRVHSAYVASLARLAIWLVGRGYDIRLLVADPSSDTAAKEDVVRAIRDRLPDVEEHLLYEPAGSVAEFLSQLAAVDVVVATRFHNIILATLCGKPVISISFHPKCRSLMEAMGLQNYCLDIDRLTAGRLIATFCDLEAHLDDVEAIITAKVAAHRLDLEDEYRAVFADDPDLGTLTSERAHRARVPTP
jgi:polysaccharide pyruvyl transferase WcaK-like protein